MADIKVGREVIKDVQLVVFDKDGTLTDLYKYWSSMVGFRTDLICQRLFLKEADNIALREAMGVDLQRLRLKPQGPVGLKKREVVMQTAIDYLETIGFSDTEQLCTDVFEEIDRHSLGHFDSIIRPIEGLYNLFDSLKKNSCKIAIATTDRTERARLAMEHLKIADQINLIVGADMVSNTKPDPEMVNLILSKLNVPRDKVIMVGDAMSDVELGVNAGLKASIGVLTGLAAEEDLRSVTRYVVPSIDEITL
ncbi:MAG: HAD family hydrolase [Candidatus Electryoneaceae bacterium]|nr:HAD family hydrolase [Candidatus Electryoneaceae bacterium]